MRLSHAALPGLLSLAVAIAACTSRVDTRPPVDLTVNPVRERQIDDVIVVCRECPYRHLFGTNGALHLWALDDVPASLEVDYRESGEAHHVVVPIAPRGNPRVHRLISITFADSGPPVAKVAENWGSPQAVNITDSANPQYKWRRTINAAIERHDSAGVERLIAEGQPSQRELGNVMLGATRDGGHAVLAAVMAHTSAPETSDVVGSIQSALFVNDLEALRMLRRFWPSDPDELSSVLQYAASDAKLETIQWLVEEAGVPVNTPVSQVGHTMLDFAVQMKRDDVAAYLRSKGGIAGYPQ